MSDIVIVDTDVAFFLLKGDSRTVAYRRLVQDKTLALAFVTVAELYRWAYSRGWKASNIAWLEDRLQAFVVVPYDAELCKWWAIVCAERQQQARPIAVHDAWIAATALRHACSLVTHHPGDFEGVTGLKTLSETDMA